MTHIVETPRQPPAAVAAAARDIAVDKERRRAWILFTGGLECFNVPIVYVLFAPYFVRSVASDGVEGQTLWANAVWISGLFAALLAPPLAFVAEHPRRRRKLMALMLLLNALPACVLWFAAPGSPMAIITLVLAAYGVAAAANDLLYVFHGSMLPEVARPAIMGRTSGLGMAIGWAISIVATGLFLLLFVWPETPLLGLDKAAGEPERLSGPFAALLMIALCLPLLLFPPPQRPERKRTSFLSTLRRETRSLFAERAAATAVLARLVYWSGVALVMQFGAIVASSIMDWGSTATSAFGVLVLVSGAIGAALGGVLDDRLGTRNALCLMLAGLGLSLSLILTMTPDRALGFIALAPRAPGAAELSSDAELIVLALGALTGAFLGTMGPMSRSLIARYSPPGRTARYYGLAALAGNAVTVVGPLFLSIVTAWSGSQRAGLLVAPAFLLLGIGVLLLLPKHGYRTTDS